MASVMKRRRSQRGRPPIRVTLTDYQRICRLEIHPILTCAAADFEDPGGGIPCATGASGVQLSQEFPAEQQPPKPLRKSRFG